jgi:hypothetical protein
MTGNVDRRRGARVGDAGASEGVAGEKSVEVAGPAVRDEVDGLESTLRAWERLAGAILGLMEARAEGLGRAVSEVNAARAVFRDAFQQVVVRWIVAGVAEGRWNQEPTDLQKAEAAFLFSSGLHPDLLARLIEAKDRHHRVAKAIGARLDLASAALVAARDAFLEYAEHHEAKASDLRTRAAKTQRNDEAHGLSVLEDAARVKASRNRELAAKCDAALRGEG